MQEQPNELRLGDTDHEPVRLIFVRHGQTIWNSQGRWQGWQNSPLTELGLQQAQEAAVALEHEKIDILYSSPAGRAVQTAQAIAVSHKLPIIEDKGLLERNYGGYEGLTSAEIELKFPGSRYQEGRDSRESWRPPGGESMAEVRTRVARLIEKVLPQHAGQTVVMVTHSGVVRAVDSLCAGKPFDELWHRVPRNACVFIIEYCIQNGFSIVQDHMENPQ